MLAFAAEGAKVAIIDRNLQAAEERAHLITQAGGQAVAFAADVSKADEVEAAVAAAAGSPQRPGCLLPSQAAAAVGPAARLHLPRTQPAVRLLRPAGRRRPGRHPCAGCASWS